MAIKIFQCVICGAEVTKPQSYAYKTGRACRTHSEVQETHTQREEEKRNNLEESKSRLENKWHRPKHEYDSSRALFDLTELRNPNEYCWCCDKDGVYEHIIMQRFLINMSKEELRSETPVSFFEVVDDSFQLNKKVKDKVKAELGEKEPLRRFEVNDGYPDWKLNQVLNRKDLQDKKQLARMTGIIVLCKDCAKTYEFPWEYLKDKLSIKEIAIAGSLIKPTFDSIAAAEIATEEVTRIIATANTSINK